MKKNTSVATKGIIKVISIFLFIFLGLLSLSLITCYPLRMSILYFIMIVFLIFILILLIRDIKKKKDKGKDKIISIIVCIIISCIIFLESFYIHIMIKDLIKGPQEAIINNITIKSRRSVSGKYKRTNYYIVGYIDNEKKKIKIVNNTLNTVKKLKKMYRVKIYYYTNTKSLYKIDYKIK